MTDRGREVQVGAVFLLALVALIAGVLWFKDFTLGRKNKVVSVDFPTTSGLLKGDLVEVQGVNSGQVSNILYEEGRSKVDLELATGIQLYPGTRFVIENVGIMGQKMVAVYPAPKGGNPPMTEGFVGEYQSGIPQLMSELGSTLSAFSRIATRLESILDSMDSSDEGALRRTLTNMDTVTSEMAQLLKDSRADMTTSLRNLNAASAELNKVLAGRGESITRLVDNAGNSVARFDSTMVRVGRVAERLDVVLARIESGDGTAAKILNDGELHQQLVETLSETRALMQDIHENPKRYVKLSLF